MKKPVFRCPFENKSTVNEASNFYYKTTDAIQEMPRIDIAPNMESMVKFTPSKLANAEFLKFKKPNFFPSLKK